MIYGFNSSFIIRSMSIYDLITRFHDDLPRLRSVAYNETKDRVNYLNLSAGCTIFG